MPVVNKRTESASWKTTNEQKRLAKVLEAILGQPDFSSLMRYLLQQAIDENIPKEMQAKILSGSDAEERDPKGDSRRQANEAG